MLHNPKRNFLPARESQSPAVEARRLRLEYNRLQRSLKPLRGQDGATSDADALMRHIERIARELGMIRADTVHAVESKLRVALDLMGDDVDDTSAKLLSSALADLHYLAVMSEPRAE